MVIPLDRSWRISDLDKSLDATVNEGFSPTHKMALWPSEDGTKLYTWGGISMGNGINPRWNEFSAQPRLRTFTPRAAGETRGQWAVEGTDAPMDSSSSPQRILRAGYGAWTTCNGLGFYMGGTVQNFTDGTYKLPSGQDRVRMPGLVIYNMTDGSWTNRTDTGIGLGSGQGTYRHGTAVCLPKAGNNGKGVVLFIGGMTEDRRSSPPVMADVAMHSVTFYDIGSATFHTQRTPDNDTPGGKREFACVAATTSSDNGKGAYEVVLFGGRPQSTAEIDVLTIPGFRWFHYDGGSNKAQISRTDHACAVIGLGQRQMISFGGIPEEYQDNTGKPISFGDRWDRSMKILDMTTMEWGDSYNHLAPAYEQPIKIREWYSNSSNLENLPLKADVRSIFSDSIDYLIKNPPNFTPGSRDGPNVAAIAGGVVGGIAAIALVAACIFYFCSYKPKKKRLAHEQTGLIADNEGTAQSEDDMLKNQQQQLQELEVSKTPHEMVEETILSTHELHGNPSRITIQGQPPQELYGSAVATRRG
ncbi:hypothetical protein PspLS_08435 [Pyricularia sp. CBS 133598]|nr:hypothetical protein PspLS_08435 [Pyricularia sp. CBS 133598]